MHDDLIEYLTRWSISNTNPSQIRVRIQSGLDLAEQQSRPEPDVLWVKAKVGRYLAAHPSATDVLLLIEVAVSSLDSDIDKKAQVYAQAGIQEYWIVDVQRSKIHVHRRAVDSRYEELFVVEQSDSLSPSVAPNAVLSVSDLFGQRQQGSPCPVCDALHEYRRQCLCLAC